MGWLTELRRRRVLRRASLPDAAWEQVSRSLPLLHGLAPAERERLRHLALLFAHEKVFEPVQGLDLMPVMRARIAAQACLPILHLGLDWYEGWTAVVVYPGEFVHRREEFDEHGLVHEWEAVEGGESWEHGPVILSWADVAASGRLDGYNVVIHEVAHKLDMLNGAPNGFPPLHDDMAPAEWSRAFAAAFDDLNARLDAGEEAPIDPYAAEDPAEFFAVLSEYFFERPRLVQETYPAVYRELRAFYRQDPARRLAGREQYP